MCILSQSEGHIVYVVCVCVCVCVCVSSKKKYDFLVTRVRNFENMLATLS